MSHLAPDCAGWYNCHYATPIFAAAPVCLAPASDLQVLAEPIADSGRSPIRLQCLQPRGSTYCKHMLTYMLRNGAETEMWSFLTELCC
ncbi:hypothetical protein N7468_004256 [Penicillium chermesinum]|uniref:Uncharacterized protein n=1 Tax=Penicillium chermesinum TaxID=63820 RepID=A0A9W9PB12_9EURO|nr:uncharacterized protein N7468_004256 [Penicillium chermesinum]KAJ5239637.1 hypothetical protein N7468_004256 [Penicillium chermesinum]